MAWRFIVLTGCAFVFAQINVSRADDPPNAQAKLSALKVRQPAEDPDRLAAAKEFQEAFEKAKSLSVRDRLAKAATVSSEVAAAAKTATAEQLAGAGYVSTSRAAIYPRASHVTRLLSHRPWLRDYLEGNNSTFHLYVDTLDLRWPTQQDAPALRSLLHDHDPDVQALAIEALATLHDPADVPSIGGLLRVDTPAVSTLSTQSRTLALSAIRIPRDEEPDPLVLEFYWRTTNIADYARRALRHMTATDLSAETFEPWLKKHRADRNSLWYWQQRLQREFDQLDHTMVKLSEQDYAKWRPIYTARRVELRDSIRKELAALDPQVEARILLLANHRHSGGTDITNPDRRFFDPPWQTRLSKADLLRLLNGEQIWDDVDWTDWLGGSGESYDRVVSRIMLNADRVFTLEDVPRLQVLVDAPPKPLMWSGRTASLIGISRLLPVAKADDLDNPKTRDGYLRKAVREDKEVFVRGYAARELVRVGLPANAAFLRDLFFAERESMGIPDLRGSILEEAGEAPLTPEKRKLLWELVSDKRCRPLLTQPSLRMGDEMYRMWAARSINAHAGRELMTSMDVQDMRDQSKTNAILDRVLQEFKDSKPPKD